MAEITRSGTPSMCSVNPPANAKHTGLLAGEALAAGDACYIKAADGRAWKSTGAAANAAAQVDGFAAEACAVGQAVTLYFDVKFRYGAALSPGARLYLSGTAAGGLADAASTGGTGPVAKVIDATRIHVWMGRY